MLGLQPNAASLQNQRVTIKLLERSRSNDIILDVLINFDKFWLDGNKDTLDIRIKVFPDTVPDDIPAFFMWKVKRPPSSLLLENCTYFPPVPSLPVRPVVWSRRIGAKELACLVLDAAWPCCFVSDIPPKSLTRPNRWTTRQRPPIRQVRCTAWGEC